MTFSAKSESRVPRNNNVHEHPAGEDCTPLQYLFSSDTCALYIMKVLQVLR